MKKTKRMLALLLAFLLAVSPQIGVSLASSEESLVSSEDSLVESIEEMSEETVSEPASSELVDELEETPPVEEMIESQSVGEEAVSESLLEEIPASEESNATSEMVEDVSEELPAEEAVVEEAGHSQLGGREVMNETLAYIYNNVREPGFGTGAGEWSILALARGEFAVADGYYDGYYDRVVTAVQEAVAVPRNEGRLDYYKSSEYSRLILALTAINKDVTDVGGINLLDGLSDLDYVKRQGINGPIFALLAYDSGAYEIPVAADGRTQTSREALVDYILGQQQTSGAWGFSTSFPSVDLTSMTLQALAPYYGTDEAVQAAVDKALDYLANEQDESGEFVEFGASNSQSVAQTLIALSALGIDAESYEPLIKNGNSLLTTLLSYAHENGGFYHMKSMSGANGMATDQAALALVAYGRFVDGKNSLYDMSDVAAVTDPTDPIDPADDSSEEPVIDDEQITIVIAVEKFALGQGYYLAPVEVQLPKGANLAEAMVNTIGADRVRYGGTFEEMFYFTEVFDPESAGALTTAPQYIVDAVGSFEENPDEWLGSGDFSPTSGWLFTVNGVSPMVGMSEYVLEDGDVVRLQFSLHEWGKDIGHGWDGSLIEPADREALTALIAQINSNPDLVARLSEDHVLEAYEASMVTVKNLEANQEAINESISNLLAALDYVEDPVEESSEESLDDSSEASESEEVEKSPTPGGNTSNTGGTKKPSTSTGRSPKTGDDGILPIVIIGGGAAGLLLFVTLHGKKKEEETK